MTSFSRPRPIVLCILDGWGHRDDDSDNAVALARIPVWKRLWRDCPHSLLQASELNVGLPHGQMGNSEVGHMNLGAGRVVMQDLPRIDTAVEDGSLAQNPALTAFIDKVKKSGGAVHLMGLLSPGGVHSHQNHILTLARIVAQAGVRIVVHAFLDGRDTPPKSAKEYLAAGVPALSQIPGLSFGTVGGRYYAMDRDKRWERTELAYEALVEGRGEQATDPLAVVERAYAAGINDEFVKPAVIAGYAGMKDGDGLLMANFRSDRVRQILTAMLIPDFDAFHRRQVKFAAAAGLSEYSSALGKVMQTMFPPQILSNGLGEIVARAGLRQLRIAETEKYAHVTFFFNGGEELEFPGEERIMVPSPKVATYDLKPEMSAPEVTDRLVDAIGSGRFDFIIVNYANTDMVGHTGDTKAAIKAVETVDVALGRLEAAIKASGGVMFITADHGNAETMRETTTGEPHTAHTLNPVPAILVNAPAWVGGLKDGQLADVAPTLLALFDLPKPKEMTGQVLLERRVAAIRKPSPVPTSSALHTAWLAASLGMLMLGAAAAAELDLTGEAEIKSRLQNTEKALTDTQKRREQFDQAAIQAAKEAAKLREGVTAAAAKAQDREEELSELESTVAALDDEMAQRNAVLVRQRHELAVLLGTLARLGRQPPELLIAMPMGPLDAVRSAGLLADTLPRIEAKAAALRHQLADLAALREQTALRRGEIAQVAAALSQDRQRLDELLARKTALQQQNEAAGREQGSRLAELAAAAGDLRELLSRLDAERQARLIVPPPRPDDGLLPPQPLDFEQARGRLLLPARGRTVVQYGQANEFGQISKGLTIETRPDAQVVAPYDGIVAFAGPFRGYGEILIMEHGDGYHSLIAGLTRVDSVPGEWVAAGEPIGVMGRPNGSDPSLYVELRRGGQPINPLPWIAARNEKAKR